MTRGAADLREAFLAFFERHGHRRVPSSPLVPAGDPTLLFTNAGMVQFKGVFLGEERRDFARATTCQKCVRAGGKHNDLENVGRTARHHTFFEMLGNFSFGDYFKADAIAFAWEFLTRELGLPRDRLCATVFTDDDEAARLWRGVTGFGDDRILRLGEKDNFWAMGDTGPCGPCSELHVHQGDHLPCAEAAAGRACLGPACECDRWLEVWNLVFMQFNRDGAGAMTPLPRPSIDTGMGLERVAAIVQGRESNFDTDLLRPLIDRVAARSGRAYGRDAEDDVSMRVIADHARAALFLVADGVAPSNEWRGYVLRRIMRRAMRHGRRLGLARPFLWEATEWAAGVMAGAYPELAAEAGRVADTVRQEEERFAETLDVGTARIQAHVEAAGPGAAGREVDGRFLFTLYDTYGFPMDLAEEAFAEAGWRVTDRTRAAAEAEMAAQRERARARAAFGVSDPASAAQLYRTLSGELPTSVFRGYEALSAPARVLALVGGDGTGARRIREAVEGDEVEVLLDGTPAYAESGGQQGDTGTIVAPGGRAAVLDTYYRGSRLIVHRVRIDAGTLGEGDAVSVTVDAGRRRGLMRHHTGTHLLHAALRRVLGTHVAQAGSLVAPDHLRFDFSHGAGVKARELDDIEALVNAEALANTPVGREEMALEDALGRGALALFGEKYGARVRVVAIGDFSTELCGGTHLDATGELGLFKIAGEGAVAAGVRRVEALAGSAALEAMAGRERALRDAADMLKVGATEVPERLKRLLDEQRELEREVARLTGRLARAGADELLAGARDVGGVPVVTGRMDGLDAEGLRAVADRLRERLGSGVVCVGSVAAGSVLLVAAVTPDLARRVHAGRLVGEVARAVGGGGGGRPDLAQAGGKDPSKLDAALGLVADIVARSQA